MHRHGCFWPFSNASLYKPQICLSLLSQQLACIDNMPIIQRVIVYYVALHDIHCYTYPMYSVRRAGRGPPGPPPLLYTHILTDQENETVNHEDYC